jgi:hypothetical protein
MPDLVPLAGWSHSMHMYGRTYYKKLLQVQEIAGHWYCWVQGCPEQVAHPTMQAACEQAMKLARSKFPSEP